MIDFVERHAPSCERGWVVAGWTDSEPVLGRELTADELAEIAESDPVEFWTLPNGLFVMGFLGQGAHQRSDGNIFGPVDYVVVD